METIFRTKIWELGNEKEVIYRNIYKDDVREIPGLTEFLKKLKSLGIRVALATMGDAENIAFVLNNLKVSEYFDVISGGHEIVNGKPDPEIFNLTLQKLNLKADECLVIEDSIDGIKAAGKAGLKVIGITTSHSPDELMNCGCSGTISNYEDFDFKLIF